MNTIEGRFLSLTVSMTVVGILAALKSNSSVFAHSLAIGMYVPLLLIGIINFLIIKEVKEMSNGRLSEFLYSFRRVHECQGIFENALYKFIKRVEKASFYNSFSELDAEMLSVEAEDIIYEVMDADKNIFSNPDIDPSEIRFEVRVNFYDIIREEEKKINIDISAKELNEINSFRDIEEGAIRHFLSAGLISLKP